MSKPSERILSPLGLRLDQAWDETDRKHVLRAILAYLDEQVEPRFCGKCGAEQVQHVKIGPGRYRASR
jgi:hypothetical protein